MMHSIVCTKWLLMCQTSYTQFVPIQTWSVSAVSENCWRTRTEYFFLIRHQLSCSHMTPPTSWVTEITLHYMNVQIQTGGADWDLLPLASATAFPRHGIDPTSCAFDQERTLPALPHKRKKEVISTVSESTSNSPICKESVSVTAAFHGTDIRPMMIWQCATL